MNRTAGMVIADDRAYLVVLAQDGEAWRVESARTKPIDDLDLDPPLDCPIVLDAAAWWPQTATDTVAQLRAAGWDVRPPAWLDGKACNPDIDDLCGAILECFDDMKDTPTLDAAVSQAFRLACYGATHETTAEPPRVPTAHRSEDVDHRPIKTAMMQDGYKAAADPRAPSWASGDLSAPNDEGTAAEPAHVSPCSFCDTCGRCGCPLDAAPHVCPAIGPNAAEWALGVARALDTPQGYEIAAPVLRAVASELGDMFQSLRDQIATLASTAFQTGERDADGQLGDIATGIARLRKERYEAERLLATMVATWDGESMRDDQAARDAASRYLVARGLLTEGK